MDQLERKERDLLVRLGGTPTVNAWDIEIKELGSCFESTCGAAALDERRARVLMWGGETTGRRSLQVFWLTDSEIELIRVQGDGPTGQCVPSMIVDAKRDALYVFGGWGAGAGQPSDEMYRLELAIEPLVWQRIQRGSAWPNGRNGAGLVYDSVQDCLLLFAGDAGRGERSFTPLDDLWRFDLSDQRWGQIEARGDLPPARWHVMMTIDEESRTAYAFGGAGHGVQGLDRHLYALDLDSYIWHRLDTKGDVPPSLQGGTLTFDKEHQVLLLCGGLRHLAPGEATSSSAWVLDIDQTTWLQVDDNRLLQRRDHVAVYTPAAKQHCVLAGKVTSDVGNWYASGEAVRSVVGIRLLSQLKSS